LFSRSHISSSQRYDEWRKKKRKGERRQIKSRYVPDGGVA
jgi:hypothetical protein